MKKIIIAILLVFSCGILALTIPKSASAETVIYDKYFSIDLDYYVDVNLTSVIDLKETLLFENVHTQQRFNIDLIELEYYSYIDYLYIDGEQTQEEYLYYTINSIYVEISYFENDIFVDTYGLNLFTEQNEEFTRNSGISVADFESATRDITNALIPRTLSSELFVESDGQIVYFYYDIYDIYPTGHTGTSTQYSYEWDPLADDGVAVLLPSDRFILSLNNLIPPIVQGYVWRYQMLTYNRENGITVVEPVYITDGNFLDFIQDATTGFFETELFGTVSIADILLFIVSVALLIFLLRFFAGG